MTVSVVISLASLHSNPKRHVLGWVVCLQVMTLETQTPVLTLCLLEQEGSKVPGLTFYGMEHQLGKIYWSAKPHYFFSHLPRQNSVTWPCLTARKAGKCSLALCHGKKENGFNQKLAHLCHLSKSACKLHFWKIPSSKYYWFHRPQFLCPRHEPLLSHIKVIKDYLETKWCEYTLVKLSHKIRQEVCSWIKN